MTPRNNKSVLITSYLDNIVSCKDISRLHVAVYSSDEIIHRGFSQHGDVPLSDPICVGEIGRTFVAALFGILLDENPLRYPLKWDTKIRSIMGVAFRFSDPWRSQEASIGDLLSDRLGFADYDFAWVVGFNPRRSTQQLCE
ncbi:hypothetical protein CAPTEDRAFT_195833 [Capitella teleta]|uniref:Uncharacterized protein n=1 Tax=Capitella teleta TaxID=283909 RepID=R7UCH9_CAPTE|nr:hypothetical protein CAPTEDRAFT_195833 [Capitella teleta]|eukprot:ELU03709.1 hypothetical protein CAPTEDRAFT_195833 [Capitella teleta]